jgi:DNA-binding transcriptional ArsR family regulator
MQPGPPYDRIREKEVTVILSPESVARFASLLADRSRAAMCIALLDGRAWTAGELARQAGIAAPTASEHLNQLVRAGLLVEERQGRHRYLRLAGPDIARLIEDLAVAGGRPAPTRSLRTVRASADLAAARTCYDHLAGTLGVWLFDTMVAAGLLDAEDGLALTTAGRSWFTDLAGPEAFRPARSRPLVRGCVDWTERTFHLAGSLGAVLCEQFKTRLWVQPCPGSRAVRVTPEGELAIADLLGEPLPPLAERAPLVGVTRLNHHSAHA